MARTTTTRRNRLRATHKSSLPKPKPLVSSKALSAAEKSEIAEFFQALIDARNRILVCGLKIFSAPATAIKEK